MDSMKHNVGNSDYAKHKIQPWDIWDEYNLNPWEADIVKRILRTKEGESRLLDYQKIKHIAEFLIEREENKKSSSIVLTDEEMDTALSGVELPTVEHEDRVPISKIMESIPLRLEKFLRGENAYYRYVHNCRTPNWIGDTTASNYSVISEAFLWYPTSEGESYWKGLELKYSNID